MVELLCVTLARSYIGTGGVQLPPSPDGCFAPPPKKRTTCNFFLHKFSITSVIRRPNVTYYLITTMLIYSVTETADIAIAGYSSIVVPEICLPQTLTLPSPPKKNNLRS